jgi:Tol biopolymer transport system component
MDADGSHLSSLTSGFADQGPVWSPDGSMIAFKSNRPGPAPAAGDHYWVVDAAGGDPRPIDTEGVAVTTAAWGHR